VPGARIASGEQVTPQTLEREDLTFCGRASANPELRYPLGTSLRSRGQLEGEWDETEGEDSADRFLICLDSEARSASNHASGRSPRADGEAADPGRPEENETERIGVVSITDADWRRPELGYWLVPEVHGEGYGKEAVSLVIEYVFQTYAHPAVGAVAYEDNDASRGLLESLGFSEEGRIRKDRFIDGEYADTIHYGLLREEWQERTRS
jgi:RimJ/RimL family protein N-acetyltransferase